MEQYIGYIQLVVIATFCYYLAIGSKLKKTWITWVLFAGSAMLAAALAYRITHSPKPSAIGQIWFQISNILTYFALICFEYVNSNQKAPKSTNMWT